MKLVMGMLAAAGLAAATGALAAEKDWTVDGTALSVTTPCAKTVSIEPATSLSGKIEISASAQHQEEIDQLAISGGSRASIGSKERHCKGNGPHLSFGGANIGITTGSTLELIVKVPTGAALEIKESGSADYRIGAVDGPLKAELHGSGDIDAEKVRDVVVHQTGSGDARFDTITGNIEGKITGSGDFEVAHADSPAAVYSLTGSGNVEIEEGKIGSLSVTISGSSDVSVRASVTDADLTLRGSGDVALREVTGHVQQTVHGSGRIDIGGKKR